VYLEGVGIITELNFHPFLSYQLQFRLISQLSVDFSDPRSEMSSKAHTDLLPLVKKEKRKVNRIEREPDERLTDGIS